jgi:ComF family protein
LMACGRFDDIDLLVPLPLFAARERKRGYNQAAVICKGISEAMDLPVRKDIISRGMQTDTQTQRTRIERWQNITGGFVLNDLSSIEGKHLLLVDDVITTGATLEACGQELLKAEGARLSIAALAYTSR